ncbi:MAG: T9SS type A sorting domain-containing protein [Chitinophagaceae bacterium]|nr:T9SS type A sorting domain-containing protein [Chitinophagaceae bacterium]
MRTLFLLCMCCSFMHPAVQAQEKYSRVSIKAPVEDKRKFSELAGLLELDHFQFDKAGNLVVEIGQREMNALRSSGYPYTVLVDDMGAWLKQENDRYYAQRARGEILPERMAMDGVGKTVNTLIATPAAFQVKATFGGYYSYAEMVTAIDNLVAAYPTLAQKINVGLSAQNRTIWAVKISDNVGTNDATEPDVLYMALQHAREAIGGSSMIFFMQYLCEQYALDTRVKSLVDAREIYIIPVVNPDGWEYNRTTGGGVGAMWRKNRRLISGSTYGVDLNRNYSVDWNTCGSVTCGSASSCGSNTASSDTYIGPSAFSEPETQAIRNFCTTGGRSFVAAIDQHAYGPYYSLPYGKTARTLTATENRFFTYVPALMGQYNGMRAGNSCESVGYEVAGGVKDWWLIGDIGTGSKGKIWGMTGEGSAGGGVSGNNFWAPASQIVNLCKGMTFQNLQLAYAAGSYADIQDVSEIDINALTGNFDFRLTRVGLEDKPVTVSIVPIENIQSVGAPLTINSLPNYYDVYNGSISYSLFPALGAGQRLRFAWKIETGGYTYYDTVTKFYQPLTIASDDMETDNGWWTFSGGWGYQSGLSYQGTRSISESPGGNYLASVGTTTSMAVYAGPTINLTGATGAYISFWVRHRAENFRDILNVEVSTDGSSWTAIPGTTTVQEPGTLDGSRINGQPALTGIREIWTRELFDLQNYLNTANLRLRFRFTSDANTTGFDFQVDQGFNIDDIKIVKTNSTFINLVPVNFLSFNGRILPDETIKLDWDVAREINHDYYEVEKSTDGSNFAGIGKVTGIGPYYFVDEEPAEGNNFYRIRQVDKDRKFTYSRTISLEYRKKDLSINIYPNPVKDALNIEFSKPVRSNLRVQVTDMTGRTIYQRAYTFTGTERSLRLDAGNWPRQQYIVKVVDEKGETLVIQKFVKY